MKRVPVIVFTYALLFLSVGSVALMYAAYKPVYESEEAAQTVDRPLAEMVRGLGAEEALALANEWGTDMKGVESFVTTTEVSFRFEDGKEIDILLPEDRMVVAVAPYVDETHPCTIHHMSGCQGELVETHLKVLATGADGSVILDAEMTTMANGFVEFWLPRDKEIQLTLEAFNKRVEGVITTYTDSKTCITTLQLL